MNTINLNNLIKIKFMKKSSYKTYIVGLILLIFILSILIIRMNWKLSEKSTMLKEKSTMLEEKTKQLASSQERLSELENNYSVLNKSYYDIIKRIQPYFKLNPEKNLETFSMENLTFIEITLPILPSVNFVVKDKDTGLNFSAVEPSEEEIEIFNKINDIRKEHNLSPLRLNKAVCYVARNHSEDMAERRYFSHDTPEGVTVYERLVNNNIYFIMAGENIFVSDNEYLNETVNDWMQSPGHRANILSDEWNEVGIGVNCIANGTYCYATADFINTVNKKENSVLNPNYAIFYYLFDPNTDIGFSQPIKVRVDLRSTEPLDIYIVSSKEDFKNYINTGNKRYIEYVGKLSNLSRELVVYKGYGIMMENNGPNTSYHNVTISYLNV